MSEPYQVRSGRNGYLVPDGVAVPTLELWQTFEHETATAIIGGVQTWEYEQAKVDPYGHSYGTCELARHCTEAVSLRLLTRNMPGIRQGESVETSLRVAAAIKEYAHRGCDHSAMKGTVAEYSGKEYVDGEWRAKAPQKGGGE